MMQLPVRRVRAIGFPVDVLLNGVFVVQLRLCRGHEARTRLKQVIFSGPDNGSDETLEATDIIGTAHVTGTSL